MGNINRKKEITNICLDTFIKNGLSETTVRDLSTALKLQSGGIYYWFEDKDDAVVACAEEAALRLEDKGEFTFDVSGESTSAHKVKVVCTDAAGNEQVEEITDFYVTTNLWVRYYTNKPLFFGSIGGVILIAGLAVALVVIKKKKKQA